MKELFSENGVDYEYYDIQSLPDEARIAVKKMAKAAGLKKFPIVKSPSGQLVKNEDLIRQFKEA